MDELNILDVTDFEKKTDKNGTIPPISSTDNITELDDTSVSADTANLRSVPKVVLHMDSERNLRLPLLRMDTMVTQEDSNLQVPRTSNKVPESPTRIMEASDLFLDPAMYNRFSVYTDLEDTLQERLAKKMEMIKDVTRERAVISISAGENAVYWLVNSFKYLTSGWFGLVILLLTILGYGSLGAFVFMLLESPYEDIYDQNIDNIRRELTNKIQHIIKNETIMTTNPDFLVLIKEDLMAYENMYSEYIKHIHNNNVTEKTWNFWNSFVFAGTIFTTIGYGHICPKTTYGRAATIVYAIIGIPLFLIVLTSFGKFLTRLIKFFWAFLFCSRRGVNAEETTTVQEIPKYRNIDDTGNQLSLIEDKFQEQSSPNIEKKNAPSVIEINEDFNLPITLALSILIFYIICGAAMAHLLESWTFFDSFYCVFISMSTIGLGDLVISDSKNMIYSILYIIFGLSLTAMCIDVVQRNLAMMFQQACEKILMLVDETDSEVDSSVIG